MALNRLNSNFFDFFYCESMHTILRIVGNKKHQVLCKYSKFVSKKVYSCCKCRITKWLANKLLLASTRNNDVDEVVFCSLRCGWLTWIALSLTYQSAWFESSFASQSAWFRWVSSPLTHQAAWCMWVSSSDRLSLIKVLNLHKTPRLNIFQVK